ncbi:sigma-70 family RNA polymerase sigma factor [Kitasatospora sp. NPDC002551]|uniref:RNA polymerase sigma factor n=1 Tax=Kitasatospora sp. NPDC002551 TaxID=3154539 RepID=UPI00332C409E
MSNAPTLSAAPTPAPRQQFEAIYRTHSQQITTYIARRLFRTDHALAEDLASETFLSLWRGLQSGLQVKYPRALLQTIAQRAISAHFERRSAWESATDFAESTVNIAAGPAFTPHLGALLAEVEQAEQALTEACTAYKTLTQRYAAACGTLANATDPEAITLAEIRRDRTALLRQAALDDFAAAALAAARARAEWNAEATLAADEPLPKRDPGKTLRRTPATVGRPKPTPSRTAAAA